MKANRTRLYLSPVLFMFPKIVLEELKKIDKYTEAFYVADVDYYRTKGMELTPLLFVHYSSLTSQFNESLKVIRDSSVYYDEYPIGPDGDELMVVFNLESWKDKFMFFIQGQYSKMYSLKEQKTCHIYMLNKGELSIRYLVLNKEPEALTYYQSVLEKTYNTSVLPDVINEYDIPPRLQHEVLNSEKDPEMVKSVLKLTNY